MTPTDRPDALREALRYTAISADHLCKTMTAGRDDRVWVHVASIDAVLDDPRFATPARIIGMHPIARFIADVRTAVGTNHARAATPAPEADREGVLCPTGCGCRIGTEDADAADCACDGPCCFDTYDDWLFDVLDRPDYYREIFAASRDMSQPMYARGFAALATPAPEAGSLDVRDEVLAWFHESEEICEHDAGMPWPCEIMADHLLRAFTVTPRLYEVGVGHWGYEKRHFRRLELAARLREQQP